MSTQAVFDWSNAVARSAELSECGRYRWWLRRTWKGGDGRAVCFVMLNPSTADALVDDPTIRRCMGFARRWGFSTLVVRNLFPFRATNPKELLAADCPKGGRQGDAELLAARNAHLVVTAWGGSVPLRSREQPGNGRDQQAIRMLHDITMHCLGKTKHGHPRHPLYVRADQPLVVFRSGRKSE